MASLTDPSQQVRRPSPGLTLPLSATSNKSNNPFLNPRTASPAALSPGLPSPGSAPGISPRLAPTNPFLAAHEQSSNPQQISNPPVSPGMPPTQARSPVDNDTAQLFHRLTLADNGPPNGAPLTKSATNNSLNGIASGHKPSLSDEAQTRRRDPRDPRVRPRPRPRPDGEREELDIFASPDKQRRPRRNSESSVLSKSSMTEEERRRRERRRREAERGASGSSKDRTGSQTRSSRRRKPRGMDLIDQLDQTGIYGAGFFHHDGPFDAVNPHRNRRKDGRAPMQAFPVGSKNMVLGGSGPLNKNLDLERIHGRGAEGFTDFSAAASEEAKKKSMLTFDPLAREDPVHGEESYGLGTSTFLEGAPASRKAIERRESETQQEVQLGGGGGGGGLQRKKSLAQRIRGMSRNDRPPIAGGRYGNGPISPDAPYSDRQTQSAGGPSRANNRATENNPFDTMYDDAFDKKGAAIKVAEQERDGDIGELPSKPMPDSPKRNALERRVTADSAGDDGDRPKTGGGFLNRVKSLRGGKGGSRYGHGRTGS